MFTDGRCLVGTKQVIARTNQSPEKDKLKQHFNHPLSWRFEMYLIPILYLIVSTLTPGPVTILTVHNTTRYGRLAGMAIGWGGAVTTAVFAAIAIVFTSNNSALDISAPNLWQQGGAIIILVMGLLTGYRSLFSHQEAATKSLPSNQIIKSFFTGMLLMAPFFPQAILFYTVILPHYTLSADLSHTVLLMGLFKLVITIGWYATVALIAEPIQKWLFATQVQRFVEFGLSCLLVGISLTLFGKT